MKSILITGANGLIGRVIARRLAKTNKYKIYGVDIQDQNSGSSNWDGASDSPYLVNPFCGEYHKLDLLNHEAFSNLLKKIGPIDYIVHLATTSSVGITPAEIIMKNVTLAKNVLDICKQHKIKQVVIASSIMTVCGKLLEEKPYSYIYHNQLDLYEKNLPPKVTCDVAAIPKKANPNLAAYIQSKIEVENLAKEYVKDGISSVCLRIGAVSGKGSPYANKDGAISALSSIWLSFRDVSNCIDSQLDYFATNQAVAAQIFYAISNNDYCWVDMQTCERITNFKAYDSAEEFHDRGEKTFTTVDFFVPPAPHQDMKMGGDSKSEKESMSHFFTLSNKSSSPRRLDLALTPADEPSPISRVTP